MEIQKHFTDVNGNHFVALFKSQKLADDHVKPDGDTEIAAPQTTDHRWIDGAWAVPAPEPATNEDVTSERDRRKHLPLTVSVTGIGAFRIDMSPDSQSNINAMSTAAMLKKSLGDNSVMTFRDADNINRDLNPDQMLEMGMQVLGAVDQIYKQSWAIKDMGTLPSDLENDAHWT